MTLSLSLSDASRASYNGVIVTYCTYNDETGKEATLTSCFTANTITIFNTTIYYLLKHITVWHILTIYVTRTQWVYNFRGILGSVVLTLSEFKIIIKKSKINLKISCDDTRVKCCTVVQGCLSSVCVFYFTNKQQIVSKVSTGSDDLTECSAWWLATQTSFILLLQNSRLYNRGQLWIDTTV